MKKKLRCAIIGTGWWSTMAHIPALKDHPQAELIAVQKRERAAAEKVAADFGIPQACTTLEEVLALDGLEAVVIGSTPNVHYAQAKAALERGLHVLIEKPMTIRAAEAEELWELSQRQGVQFLVSCPWHYTAHAAKARKLVAEGALGSLKMISVLMTNFTEGLYRGLPWEGLFRKDILEGASRPYLAPRQDSYSDPAIAGGGQIYCQFSHVGAWLALVTGRQASEVFARFDEAGTSVDVYDALTLRLDDGALVTIATHGAAIMPERTFEVRIFGTEGVLFLELWKGTMAFQKRDGTWETFEPLAEADIYPLYAPARNLVDAALGLAPNLSPASLGVSAMKITDAACESVRTGSNIILG